MTTPASVINSTMKALPLVLIIIAVLSVPGKAASVQVSVALISRYSKQVQREFITVCRRRPLPVTHTELYHYNIIWRVRSKQIRFRTGVSHQGNNTHCRY
jgi:hypothetical protein